MALTGIDRTGSPDWWFNRLSKRLIHKRSYLDELDCRARNEPPLPPEYRDTQKMGDVYIEFVQRARTNVLGLITPAVTERLKPIGIRTGADDDDNGDDQAWNWYRQNDMEYWVSKLFTASLNMGDAYVMVSAPVDGVPRWTVEDPRQCITEEDPATGKELAGLKVFYDDVEGFDRAVLQLTGGLVVWYQSERKAPRWRLDTGYGQHDWTVLNPNAWSIDDRKSGTRPIDDVLMVRFPNQRDLQGRSYSEFASVIPIQDRINRQVFDRMMIAASQAFRQRWVKGQIPTKDASGNEIKLNEVLRAGPDALWALFGDVDFGEFSTADLTQLLKANEADVMAMAKITRTPAQHMLGGDLVNIGADAYTASLDPFLAKCGEHIREKTSPLRRSLSLGFQSIGDTARADLATLTVLWANPQRYTLAERTDAALKSVNILSSRTIKREIYQMTPQDIARDEADRERDLLDPALSMTPATGGANNAVTADTGGQPGNSTQPTAQAGNQAAPAAGNQGTGQ